MIKIYGDYMNSTDDFLLPRTGKLLKNRAVLAAMTNKQSHENGILSHEEKKWLIRRAMGEFAIITTAATNVTEHGRGWFGEMGVWGDHHIPELTNLAIELKKNRNCKSCSIIPWRYASTTEYQWRPTNFF
jgi:2,4-dienoyl-CoA reductase-like NADH-dependent reductase (Old Yellow Enzyme family)